MFQKLSNKSFGRKAMVLMLVFCLLLSYLPSFNNSYAQQATTSEHNKQVIGYITQWDAWKAANAGLPAQGALTHLNIDFSKYTILNFSFFGVANDGSLHSGDYRNKNIYMPGVEQAPSPMLCTDIYSSWDLYLLYGEIEATYTINADVVSRATAQGFVVTEWGNTWSNPSWGLYDQPLPLPLKKEGGAPGLFDLAKQHGVKVMASIGGWSMCKHYFEVAANPIKRARFISDCVKLINMGFDGIDLDWEYPGPYSGMNFTGTQADYNNFLTLVQGIRQAIGNDKLITSCFAADTVKLGGFNWSALNSVLNYYNFMTYDFNGGWSDKAGHNSPLYSYSNAEAPTFNWDSLYNYLVTTNIDISKVNMGIPFYGRGVITNGPASLNAATVKRSETVQPDGPIQTCADFTNWPRDVFDGTPYYYFIKQTALAPNSGWTKHWDNEAKVPYLTKDNYFLSYDDEESIGYKAQYIKDKNLAGTIIWTVYEDLEFGGTVTSYGTKLKKWSDVNSPLVSKINNVFADGYVPVPTVATPAFSIPSGTYTSAQNVTITCATAGATIHYTTNGTEPIASSAAYSGPISISATTTLKAKAFKAGMNDSAIVSATYTISADQPVETVATPTFSIPAGTYASAQNVAITCATAGATIRYTTNGSEPTSSSSVYSGPVNISITSTLKAKAIKSGMNDSVTVSAVYTIEGGNNPVISPWEAYKNYLQGDIVSYSGKNYECRQPHMSLPGWEPTNVPALWLEYTGTVNPIEAVASPVFSVAGGTYSSAQSVAISCATAGANIHYTTNGSEPTASSPVYSSPISISATTTLKAKAFRTDMNASGTVTATYTIVEDPVNPQYPLWSRTAIYQGGDHVIWNGYIWRAQWWTTGEEPGTTGEWGVWRLVGPANNTPVETVASPIYSPSGGTYSSPQSVSITCPTVGAAIRYTTNGSTPTASSTIYTGAITISSTTVLKAKAFKEGLNESAVVTATYIIGDPGGNDDGFKVVGYYPSWQPAKTDRIQYDILTHINYAFAIPTADGGILPLDNPTLATSIINEAHANGVKVLIAVGGWEYNNQILENTFIQATSTDAKIQSLTNAIVALVNQYGFDGVDMDWEHPRRGTTDMQYQKLMLSLSNALKPQGKLLTSAVLSGVNADGVIYWDSAAHTDAVLNAVDWINVMAYDGGDGDRHSSYQFAVNCGLYWRETRNMPAAKVVLGVPFYGRPSWASYDQILQANPNAYNTDVSMINGMEAHYNGIPTIKSKTIWAKQNLGGVMMWEISQDTLDRSKSLLTAIGEVIYK